jgi:hypothetical protein
MIKRFMRDEVLEAVQRLQPVRRPRAPDHRS